MFEYEIEKATTPEEMRAAIFKLRFEDPLVRGIWDQADFAGWSAEDKYTAISYSALVKAKSLFDAHLQHVRNDPRSIILPEG